MLTLTLCIFYLGDARTIGVGFVHVPNKNHDWEEFQHVVNFSSVRFVIVLPSYITQLSNREVVCCRSSYILYNK